MNLLFKCFVGGPTFIGWFISYYLGEMILTWLVIVPDHPEWKVRAAILLTIPAAMLALRHAASRVEQFEKSF